MKIAEIKELITLFSDSDITELLLELDNLRLHLSKLKASTSQPVEEPVFDKPSSAAVDDRPVPEAIQEQPTKLREILAPMVGIFYRAPSPDSDPYVEVGTLVEKGQTLCIIEAMKLMNEIESEYRGRVAEILVENGQPVEYGQPLFLIEPVE